MSSSLFDEGMTVVRVGPEDLARGRGDEADGAVVCFTCGNTAWVEDRTYDWKRGARSSANGRTIRNAPTWKCAGCGRHRRRRA